MSNIKGERLEPNNVAIWHAIGNMRIRISASRPGTLTEVFDFVILLSALGTSQTVGRYFFLKYSYNFIH
jgi:hypothetical protein